MASTRHVSRWRLCRPPQAPGGSETSSSSPSNASEADAKVSPSAPPVSLRYLNEFVGKLHCAPALLQHGLFPDAKEVTESMALFNAVRRYIEPKDKGESLEKNDKHDGIVVVGDGNTPRTAGMFAFRMRGWKCYSVDPAMEKGTSERSKGWAGVSNLVVVRNKIENVRIALRRAIVVLVHAHVTLDQALSAVQAEQVCGVVTLPCCNWYGQQEALFGRGPDLVYDDFSVLSDHREIRLWVGDNSAQDGGNVDTSHADLSLASSVMKGCVRKEMIAVSENTPTHVNAEKQAEDLRKRHNGVLEFIGDTLGELARDASSMSQEEYMAEEETVGSSLPSAVALHLGTDTNVLALGWHPRRLAVRLLLRDGYTDVYTISVAEELSFSVVDNGERGTKTLKLQLLKCTVDLDAEPVDEDSEEESVKLEPCGRFILQSTFALPRTEQSDEETEEEEKITVSFENEGSPAPPLACVLDAGFIFRGFRGRAKKNPSFFRHLCRTLDQLVSACGSPTTSSRTASLVCLTPRKQWRKKEFLAHTDLDYDVQSLIATRKLFPGTPVYVYCCFKRQTLSSIASPAAVDQPTKLDDGDGSTIARDAALETWLELDEKLNSRQSELDGRLIVIDSPAARVKAAQDQEQTVADARDTAVEPRKVYVQVTGEISRVRRFSNGMAFLSLELAGSGYDRPLQVFLQRDTLGWSPSVFAKVVGLLRKGDELIAVGFMARNARGHSMLQVEALSLARTGEYEAYS
ncbi:hypothetical protein PHYPSEUDO_014635 [Phytophthora pseudosyringae]|uniref:Uncharacterized protein n=1 Tax=Phytophthora pseudosyringae TaxID=221518 RepID=A0A8T1W124_9STRA|nr:hypothetical protein PHYPSEUDO_014635 [Phytophthora pseudosyringae]